MTTPKPLNYWDYIRVEELLTLQRGLAPSDAEISNDEVMFITVHQVYELWLKLILRELTAARDLFKRDHVAEQELSGAVRGLKRMTTIFRVANQHWEVMETLTTREYLGFRDKLMGASGFQSAQLRQIEILFGLDERARIPLGVEPSYIAALRAHDGRPSPALARVEKSLADKPTFKETIEQWLFRTPIDGVGPTAKDADAALERFIARCTRSYEHTVDATMARALSITSVDGDKVRLRERYGRERNALAEFLAADGDVRRRRVRCAMVFIETYRELPLLAWPRELLDAIVEVEQLFVIFRQRHARMVERVIGRRTGTGGSAGVDYLDKTALEYRIFRDLWAVRTLQMPRSAAPELERADFYGFKSG
ncbi:MAG: tryptophan 2,3-dioxygenase [Planctomycetes bacterium]|nr:tryptophan 2,3-dioxygenase [Planctomycetota bacterium]